MMGALIGVGGAFLLAFIGGVWHLSGKITRVETRVEALPTRDDLNGKIRDHQDHCPAYRAETSAVSNPPHPAPWAHE